MEIPLYLNNISTGYPRVTGIRFTGTTSGDGVIYTNVVKNLRIDHCEFYISGSRAMYLIRTDGCIDNCTFDSPTYGVGVGMVCMQGNNEVDWALSPPWGLATGQMVVEDCDFTSDGTALIFIDSTQGASYTARYNTFTGGGVENHGSDQNPPPIRASRLMEIYRNTFTYVLGSFNAITLRGGSGVAYSNTISGAWINKIMLANYRSEVDDGTLYHTDWNRCDGSNPIDGNTAGEQGWPSRDQVGRLQDSFEWEASLPFTGPYPTQALDPFYQWDNSSIACVINDGGSTNPSQADHIKINRDYYDNTTRPSYSALSYPHPLRGESASPYVRIY